MDKRRFLGNDLAREDNSDCYVDESDRAKKGNLIINNKCNSF